MSQTPATPTLAPNDQQAPASGSAVLNPSTNRQQMKFRLLMGRHIQAEVAPDGRIYQKTYLPGATIESHMDLERFNGDEVMSKKFERVHDNPVAGSSFDDGYRAGLEAAMTQAKLDQAIATNPVSDAAKTGFNTLHTDANKPVSQPTTTPPQHRPSTQVTATHSTTSKEGMIQTLNTATLDELKRIAAEEEIDLGKARNREDVLKAVKAGMGL